MDNLAYNPKTGQLYRKGKPVGCVGSDGYLIVTLDGKQLKAHRVAWAIHHGKFPEGHVDHINGDRTDNRIENLRDVTRQENQRNLKKPSHNKSGVVGVSWDASRGSWYASIQVGGKTKNLGRWQDKRCAVAIRRVAEHVYGFHENHGRR